MICLFKRRGTSTKERDLVAFNRELTEQQLLQAAAKFQAAQEAVNRKCNPYWDQRRDSLDDARRFILSSTKLVYGINDQILQVINISRQSSTDDAEVRLVAETLNHRVALILDDAQVNFNQATLLHDNYDGLFAPDQEVLVNKALRIAAETLDEGRQHAEILWGYAEELIYSHEVEAEEYDAEEHDAEEQLAATQTQLAAARAVSERAQMSVAEHDELFAEGITEPLDVLLLEQTEHDEAALAPAVRIAPPRRLRPLMRVSKSRILLLEHDGLLQFSDKVIRAGENFNEGLPTPSSTQAGIPGLTLEFRSNLSGVTYEGVQLAPGDVIRSHIVTNGQVGVLKQDYTGKVTNMSQGLGAEELGLVMLKAAKCC